MSGGSWNYLYMKMENAADEFIEDKRPLRRAFGKKMRLYAKAMHDIEWVDSLDTSKGSEEKAIKKALGENCHALTLAEIIKDAKVIKKQLEEFGI